MPSTTPVIPLDPWKPTLPAVFNGPGERSPLELRAVCAQFDVEHAGRYAVRDMNGDGRSETFCNIYVWDATTALKAEVPHWVGKSELNANAVIDWLAWYGSAQGWLETGKADALAYARRGCPVVVCWKNVTGGSGHVAMMLPPHDTEPRIAQAGRRNLFDVPLSAGFGARPIRFYVHE
jgi:hypothetical protein